MKKFIKKFWKDNVGSNLIAAIILAAITLIYNYVTSVVNDSSFSKEFIDFINLKIDLWLVFIIFIIWILAYSIKQLLEKNKKFKYDSETIKLDIANFNTIRYDLLNPDTVYNFKTHTFSNGHFKTEELSFLNLTSIKAKDPEFEFFNPELEKLKKLLLESLYNFEETVRKNIFGTGNLGFVSVPKEWEIKKRLSAINEIRTTEIDFIKCYDTFIRKCRETLKT